MPIVDLDDELSIVGEEEAEEEALDSPMNAFSDVEQSVYSGMKSDASAMEEMSTAESQDGHQQWMIDMHTKGDDSPEGMNVSGSETDDSSLYLTEMDNLEESVRNPESKQLTPKTKNQKKAAAPSPNDDEYQNYMDVSGIVDNFGEDDDDKGWKKKVTLSLKKKQEPKEKSKKATVKSNEDKPVKKAFGVRRNTNGSDKSEEAKPKEPKESWRSKNPFLGKNAKKAQGKEPPADETNLAPLADFDAVATPKEEEKKEGWMPKISFLGKTSTEDASKDDFEEQYAADLAPLGAVADVEANVADVAADEKKPEAQAGWSSKMSFLISGLTEPKQEPKKAQEESNLDDDKSTTSSVGLTDSINLANDIVSSLAEYKTEESEAPEESDAEQGEDIESLDDCVTEEDDVEETEGSFVGTTPADDNDDSGPVEQTEVPEGSDDKKKTWTSKVKSVRKKSSSKLSSIRKSGKAKLSQKSFTEDKMKELEAAGDDKTVETGGTIKSNDSDDGHGMLGGMSDRRKKTVGIVTLSVLFVCVIIGIVVGTRNAKSDAPNKIEVPVERVEYLYKLLFPISGNDLEVEDPDDPLVKAFIWTAEDSMVRSDPDDEIIKRYVSAAVYHSLGGENWTNRNNFLSHDDLCSWNDSGVSGIICPDGEEITELQLANNNLVGSIPEEIRHLRSLQLIRMEDNAITGLLTEELFQLDWLEELHLSSNSLSGTVPDAIGEGAILKVLDLTGNQLSGPIPEFSDRTSIQRLYLGLNDLKGTIPDSLALAPDLETLHLPKMSLTGTIPALFQSASLRAIELRGNKLTGNIEDVFNSLPMDTIEKITLSNNKFRGTLPLSIGDFYKLEELRLEGNKIVGTIPTTMGDLNSLKSLRLRLNRLTGTIPSELGGLSLVRDLLLDGNELEGIIPSELASLPNLENLMLSENKAISGGTEPFCARESQLGLFGVNTCGSTDVECPCCNSCCSTEPAYGCFTF